MSHKPARDRVEHILRAIDTIGEFTEGMTEESFTADPKTISAVAYQLSIIGEAVRLVPEDILTRFPEVPWDQMRAMRNVVVHEYHRVDSLILWDTVQRNLPALVEPLRRLLQEERNES